MFGKKYEMSNLTKNKISSSLLESKKLKESRMSVEFRNGISDRLSVPLVVLDLNLNLLYRFKNSRECSEFFGYTRANIKNAVRDFRKIGRSNGKELWVIREDYYTKFTKRII